MKTKHTKGEWKIYELQKAYHINANYTHVASLTRIDMPKAEANAKLIASAPELLDACITLLHNFEVNKMYNQTLTETELTAGINILNRVISKATE